MEREQFAALGIVGIIIVAFIGIVKPKPTTKTMSLNSGTSATTPKTAPAAGNAVDFAEWPTNRALTKDELYALAQIIVRNFGVGVYPEFLTTTADVESSRRPWVERYEPHINDYSSGLMQTLVSTANDLYKKGYRAYGKPTRASLKNPVQSMYFGAAYYDWLMKSYPGKDLEWYVRAYNGGAGHKYNSMTTAYWNKWQAAGKDWGVGGGIYFKFGG